MRPYAITSELKTWCGFRQGEKVIGYKDRNGYYYWFKTKKTAMKYAEKYADGGRYIHYATLQGIDEATIYNTYLGRF